MYYFFFLFSFCLKSCAPHRCGICIKMFCQMIMFWYFYVDTILSIVNVNDSNRLKLSFWQAKNHFQTTDIIKDCSQKKTVDRRICYWKENVDSRVFNREENVDRRDSYREESVDRKGSKKNLFLYLSKFSFHIHWLLIHSNWKLWISYWSLYCNNSL